MKKFIVYLLIGVVLLVGIFEFAAPRIVSKGIEVALSQMAHGDYQVILKSHPSLKMLLGHFDSMEFIVKGAEISGVKIDEISTKVNDVKLNIQKLVFDKTLDFQGKKNIKGNIKISEKNLTEAMGNKGFAGFEVKIQRDKAVISGKMKLVNKPFDINMEGRFVPLENTKLGFEVDDVKVGGVAVPKNLQEKLFSGTIFYVDFKKAPIPLTIDGVLMQPGLLLIEVSN